MRTNSVMWACNSCKKMFVVVVPRTEPDELVVQRVSNKEGLTLSYVCSHCTNISKDAWLGVPKRVRLVPTGYAPMSQVELLFDKPDVRYGTLNGEVQVYCSGDIIPNRASKEDIENRFVVTTHTRKQKLKTFVGRQIICHYRRECVNKCPVCLGKFQPDNKTDEILRNLGSKGTMWAEEDSKPLADVKKELLDVEAEQERVPTEEELLQSEAPEYFPDSHEDIQEYLDNVEAALDKKQELAVKKRKVQVKKELESFFE